MPAGAHALDAHYILHASGRWNRAGEYGALYTADSPDTVRAERKKQLQRDRLGIDDDRDLVALEVEVEPVLDLTSRSERRSVGVTKRLITGDTRACKEACEEVADRARLEGAQAILAPSAAPGGDRVLAIYIDVGPTEQLSLHEVPEERRPLNYEP